MIQHGLLQHILVLPTSAGSGTDITYRFYHSDLILKTVLDAARGRDWVLRRIRIKYRNGQNPKSKQTVSQLAQRHSS
jgi:hypothetical protein